MRVKSILGTGAKYTEAGREPKAERGAVRGTDKETETETKTEKERENVRKTCQDERCAVGSSNWLHSFLEIYT